MTFDAASKLEAALGSALPSVYRDFLTDHHTTYLDPCFFSASHNGDSGQPT